MKVRFRPVIHVTTPIKNLAQRFAFLGFVIFSFVIILSSKADVLLVERLRARVTDAFAPILDAMSRPVATAANLANEIKNLTQIRAENLHLKEERKRLLQWQSAARQLDAENKVLRELLKFTPPPKASFITARVIADAVGAFAHNLLLNAGAPDGVRKDQAVITSNGLVGRVASVGLRSSWVLLVTDLNSRIPVVVETTRTRAIMAGNNSEQPRLIHLAPGALVSPGERIITSGHGGIFPPGLAIGEVASVSDGGIEIRPYNDFHHMEYVHILNFGEDGVIQPIPLPSKDAPEGKGEKKTP